LLSAGLAGLTRLATCLLTGLLSRLLPTLPGLAGSLLPGLTLLSGLLSGLVDLLPSLFLIAFTFGLLAGVSLGTTLPPFLSRLGLGIRLATLVWISLSGHWFLLAGFLSFLTRIARLGLTVLLPGRLGLFVLQGLLQVAQFALGELQGLGLVAKYALGGFLDTLLEVVQLTLGTVAESLARLAEITLAKSIDQLLLLGFILHHFLK
tara:strand:+ start:402 stop:1019 length:618 start_codon:yes stop_codon:yes gene_type:complete